MNMFKTLLIAALLAGCATPEQKAAQKVSQMDAMVQIYGPACEHLGFKPNTDQWRGCILQLDAKDDAERYNDAFEPHHFWPRPWR